MTRKRRRCWRRCARAPGARSSSGRTRPITASPFRSRRRRTNRRRPSPTALSITSWSSPPPARDAFAHAGKADVLVKWIPKASDGFLAITGLNKTIQAALDQSGNQAAIKSSTDIAGLTGPGGVLPHLTGDAGLEVELGSEGIPAGAILLATDDARSMNAFFARILALADGAAVSNFGSSPLRAARVTTTTYRGVVITSWASPALAVLGASAFSSSYALLEGMGILAVTPAAF